MKEMAMEVKNKLILEGKEIVGEYERQYNNEHEKIYIVKQNDKYGLYDYEGFVILDCNYDEITFENGTLKVVSKVTLN